MGRSRTSTCCSSDSHADPYNTIRELPRSGRQDSNLRPPGSKPGALAKLSYILSAISPISLVPYPCDRDGWTRTSDLLLPTQAPWPLGYIPNSPVSSGAQDARRYPLARAAKRLYSQAFHGHIWRNSSVSSGAQELNLAGELIRPASATGTSRLAHTLDFFRSSVHSPVACVFRLAREVSNLDSRCQRPVSYRWTTGQQPVKRFLHCAILQQNRVIHGLLIAGQGFEPRFPDSESSVLPDRRPGIALRLWLAAPGLDPWCVR